MYRLQRKAWGEWCNVRVYKTKRAAMANMVKRKFEQPDIEWRVSTEPDYVEVIAMKYERGFKDGLPQ